MMSARGLNCIFVDVVLVQIGVGVVLVVVVEELSGYLSVDLGLLMLAAIRKHVRNSCLRHVCIIQRD
jgi:hypothetical protein